MKHIKLRSRLTILLVCSILIAGLVITISNACKSSTKVKIGISYDSGAVALSAMKENPTDYELTALSDVNSIMEKIDSGKLDIAVLPSNLAATLYNKEHNVTMTSIINLCAIKVISQDQNIKSLDDITNQRIFYAGENNEVGAILGILTNAKNFNARNANVIYKPTVEEVLSNVSADSKSLGIVTQPQAGLTARLNNSLYEILDVADQWHKIYGQNSNPVSLVTVVNNNFLKQNKNLFLKFIEDEKESINNVNSNPAQAAYAINEIMNSNNNNQYNATDISNCNIVYFDGNDMKTMASDFYKLIYDWDPSYIGNVIPDDKFYYIED